MCADVLADSEYDQSRLRDLVSVRAGLAVPMMRRGIVVGKSHCNAEPLLYAKQIELVTTFADQAVIAIKNVRSFSTSADAHARSFRVLEQQTATSGGAARHQ